MTRTSIPSCPDLVQETLLWPQRVAGLDEAGRGAWAGPVSAAAVILPPGKSSISQILAGVRDSKQMTPRQRAEWAGIIRAEVLAWGVGFAAPAEIDALGIVPATRLAMGRALACLACAPEHLLVDALRLPAVPLPQTALVHGDARCLSIAAASVLAKTARDALLESLESEYPGYGFARHKGYGVAAHRLALQRLGPAPVHRLSFAPLRYLTCGL